MNIQSMSASAGTNAGVAGASKNAGASGGFQGVLVQKIGAAEPTAGTVAGASNPMLGLAGLLTAALGVVADEPGMNGQAEGGEQVSQLLDTLDDKLGQLQDQTDLPNSLLDQLAELLASLQGLLQPNQTPSLGSGDANGEPAADSAAQLLQGSGGAVQQPGAAVISTLANAVKELRTQLQSGQLSPAEIAAASVSIKSALLGKLADPTVSKSDEKKQAQTASPAIRTATDETGSADGLNVQPEIKKAYPVFKEPVVYWNLNHANTHEDGEASGQSLVTEPAAAVDEQPVTILWQHVTSDVGNKADAAAVLKQQAPVTIPGQQFAEQMDKFLVKQFTLTGGNGISEANINLHPEHLGEVQIKLTMQHGQLSAQFVTHNEAAKELLENQMAQLRGSLQSQGIQVDRVEVVQQQPAADASAFMNQERRRQHSGGGGESKGSSGGTETLEQFEEELERTASLKDAGYGGSLNVTA